MALSTIDQNTALIVVDLQRGIAALPAVHPVAGVAANAGRLAAAFRGHGLPVVLVSLAGSPGGRTERSRTGTAATPSQPPADWAELLPQLDAQPRDHLISKKTRSAFIHTGLDEHLRDAGVTQVVIAGVATSIGVESTARSAHDLGYHVTVAVDAMTDLSAEAHQHSVSRIFPGLGESGTTDEVLTLLDRDRR